MLSCLECTIAMTFQTMIEACLDLLHGQIQYVSLALKYPYVGQGCLYIVAFRTDQSEIPIKIQSILTVHGKTNPLC